MENKDLTKQENKDLELFFDASNDLGDGFEETTNNDLQPNFLKVAQKEVADPNEAAYIEGVAAGDFYDTISKQSMGKKLKAVVLHFNTTYVEWGKDLGEYRGQFKLNEFKALKNLTPHESKIGTMMTPEGTSIVETKNYYLYLPDYPEKGIVLFCLSSSGAKLSKMWEPKFQLIKKNGKIASRYFGVWEIETQIAKSEKHKKSWYAIGDKSKVNADFVGFVPTDHQANVMNLRSTIKEWIDNDIKINYSNNSEEISNSELENEI